MLLFDSAELPQCRWCGYCQQPLAATLENFSAHKYGRHGLATICRSCANSDRVCGSATSGSTLDLTPVRAAAVQGPYR